MLVVERTELLKAGDIIRDFTDNKSYMVIEVEETVIQNDQDRFRYINLMCLTDSMPKRSMLRDLFFYEYME
jgi:hypothetical protein